MPAFRATCEAHTRCRTGSNGDDAPAIGKHLRSRPDVRNHSSDIDRPHPIQLCVINVWSVEGLTLEGHRRIIYENVEPAEALRHGLDERLRFRRIALIRPERGGSHALGFQPLHNLVRFRYRRHVADGNIRAFIRERECDANSEPS
jgi:hypothetical protein